MRVCPQARPTASCRCPAARRSERMPPRRLLVVTYYHPPDPTGGHRWAAMGHWLRSLGYEVTTITASAWGTLDDALATDTHRTGDLVASGVLRRLLRRPPF